MVLSHFGFFISQVSILQMVLPILAANFHQNQAMMSHDDLGMVLGGFGAVLGSPVFFPKFGMPQKHQRAPPRCIYNEAQQNHGPNQGFPDRSGALGQKDLGMEALRRTG